MEQTTNCSGSHLAMARQVERKRFVEINGQYTRRFEPVKRVGQRPHRLLVRFLCRGKLGLVQRC